MKTLPRVPPVLRAICAKKTTWAKAAALGRSSDGVAAIEFAFVLPAMLVMYFGLVAVTVGINTARKITLISRTVSDLTGRALTMTDAEVNTVTGAAAAVLSPYTPDGLMISVASVVVRDLSGNGTNIEAKVCWSTGRQFASSGTATVVPPTPSLAQSAVISPIPDGFRTPNSTFIITKVTQLYRPVVGASMTGNINLGETTPWPVRNVQEVPYTGVRTFKDIEMSRTATGKCLN